MSGSRLAKVALMVALFGGAMAGACAADAPGTITVEIGLADGRITPAVVDVPAGARVRLALRNQGRGPAEFENLDLRVEKVLGAGAASTLVLHPLRPGSYRFVDEFHPEGPGLTLRVR